MTSQTVLGDVEPSRDDSPGADPEPNRAIPQTPLYALFGTGRSGSTWLGSILDSHPGVTYRFEPFHRMGRESGAIRHAQQRIMAEDFGRDDLDLIYQSLRAAFPKISKPPFFPKQAGFTWGREALWKVGRVELLGHLYAALYSPPDRQPLIFKEVNLERMMDRLIQRTRIPIIYLLRHPCAFVSSVVRGQEQDLMSSNRLAILPDLLRDHAPHLTERYRDRIPHFDDYQKNALLWRIDVDEAWNIIQGQPNVTLIVYENLCRDPLTWAKHAFAHFEIPFHEQTERFVRDSTRPEEDPDLRSDNARKDDYFNVFRNPEVSMNKWKTRMSPEQQTAVLEIVEDSPAYRYGREHADWA